MPASSKPEELSRLRDEPAQHTSVAQVARPLGCVHGLRLEDPVLEAFLRLRQSDHRFLPVLDRPEALAGIVTSHDIERWFHNNGLAVERVICIAAEGSGQTAAEKIAG
jgi:CBS-domain-containing membrane protein